MVDGVKRNRGDRAATPDPAPHPKSRVREARAELYRRLILEAAERTFAQHGYADTRMQAIATEGGLSLKTVYAAFPGKAELFRAIRDERRDELLTRLKRETRAGDLDECAQVMEGVRLTAEFFMGHPDFLRIQLRDGNAWALPPDQKGGPGDNRWHDVMRFQTQLFERGIRADLFVDEDPETLARMVTALIQVKLSRWLEDGAHESSEPVVAAIRSHIERAFCRSGPGPSS